MPIQDLPKVEYNLTAADTIYSDVLEMVQDGIKSTEATVHLTEVTGTAFTINITPQYSYDKLQWFDAPVANSFVEIDNNNIVDYAETVVFSLGRYVRYKFVIAGADIDVVLDFYAVAKSN